MMTFLLTVIPTLVTLLSLFIVVPRLAAHVLRLAFRGFGCLIERKARGRRELIRSRVRVEEEEYRSSRHKSTRAEDDDWEKIEGHGLGSATNGDTGEGDWEGIVGFFHPFW
jgi:alpha-1,2-mannosyltransferase